MDDLDFDAYIPSSRSQAFKASPPKERPLHRCHYENAKDEVESQKRDLSSEEGEEDGRRRMRSKLHQP